jgi:hypothetical protein
LRPFKSREREIKDKKGKDRKRGVGAGRERFGARFCIISAVGEAAVDSAVDARH